jgi:hypothetical protein
MGRSRTAPTARATSLSGWASETGEVCEPLRAQLPFYRCSTFPNWNGGLVAVVLGGEYHFDTENLGVLLPCQ